MHLNWDTIVVTALTVIGTVSAAWLTGRANAKTKRAESEATPYEQLARRVMDLEKSDEDNRRSIRALETEVDSLHRERTEDRAWIARALDYLTKQGITLPFPLPEWHLQRKDT